MKKRLVSILLAVAMCMGLAVPAVAVEPQEDVWLVQVDGEMVEVRSYDKDGIPYISVDGQEFYLVGNEIFCDEEKMATIGGDSSSGIMPLTGWLHQENCPYGTRYEYNKHIESADKIHDIKFEQAISLYGAKALLAAVTLACKLMTPNLYDIFAKDFFDDIQKALKNTTAFGDATALYAKERVFAHDTLGSIYRMNIFILYKDKALTSPVESNAVHTYYSVWA